MIFRIFCSFLIFMIVSGGSMAQEKVYFREHDISRDSLLQIARGIIEIAPARTLITVDEYNRPQARAMSPFPPEEDFSIWLGTDPKSRKVKQIQANPQVMVYYYEPEGMSYVSVAGKAKLIDDAAMKKKYWRDSWKNFYPDPEKDYVLIQIEPEHMEICSFVHELFWSPEGRPAAIDF